MRINEAFGPIMLKLVNVVRCPLTASRCTAGPIRVVPVQSNELQLRNMTV